MKVSISKLENKPEIILPLAKAYKRSYNKLSDGYKSPEEMKLYTEQVFIQKLKRFAQDKDSQSAVLMLNDRPYGFVRYSYIPGYYKENQNGNSQDLETGYMDGYEFAWNRKIKFEKDVQLDDKTLIVNQIYLDPEIQRRGLGTYLFGQTLPKIKEQGFESLIIEYNAQNKNAERFYQTLGFEAFAHTQDFDHITRENNRANFCISDVKIAHATIDKTLRCVQNIENRKKFNLAARNNSTNAR